MMGSGAQRCQACRQDAVQRPDWLVDEAVHCEPSGLTFPANREFSREILRMPPPGNVPAIQYTPSNQRLAAAFAVRWNREFPSAHQGKRSSNTEIWKLKIWG